MPAHAKLVAWAGLWLAMLPAPGIAADTQPAAGAPTLAFEAPASLAADVRRLEQLDPGRLVAVVRLVGLADPGPPIRVLLAPETSDLARNTPPFVSAYATADVIVLLPQRTLSYPYETLEEVVQHEVAHVLITRAAGHRRVPRWFHEGVARLAEHSWSLGEQTRFLYEISARGALTLRQLDALFAGSGGAVARAYAVSGAFMQDLVGTYGPDLPKRVLSAMRSSGLDFDGAFRQVTGVTPDDASASFWRRNRFWLAWLPWLTSAEAIYLLMTMLAVAAIWRVRARRRAAREAMGEGDEAAREESVTADKGE